MKLISVNIAHTGTVLEHGKPMPSGIFKNPTFESVSVGPLGLEGDFIGELESHGGPDQAVYVYSLEDYAWWSQQLGRDLEPGTFGENLTLQGLDFSTLKIGDRLKMGEVLLEVTFSRIPCRTLGARMNDLGFVKKFVQAERPGLYCRVLEPETVQAGQSVEFLQTQGPQVTALELFRFWFEPNKSRSLLERALSVPLGERGRLYFERLLAQEQP